jgi:hypothetical protein
LAISADVADDRIELGQRDLQRMAPNDQEHSFGKYRPRARRGQRFYRLQRFCSPGFCFCPEIMASDCS